MADKTNETAQFSLLQSGSLLSAKELFRYRKGRDTAPPQKGGAKEYAPDGSWLEMKKIEYFHRERKNVLSEQRVEMVSSLVIGDWNIEKQLVEFEREIGKFWTHMGFIDHKRKWLYPEEALFLMETGTLEVWFKNAPLSIQQAYSTFLNKSTSLEEYQVYAHLRRYGYVVLRHQGKISITKYERDIGLDQYVDQKQRKRRAADHGNAEVNADDKNGSDYKKKKTSSSTPLLLHNDLTTGPENRGDHLVTMDCSSVSRTIDPETSTTSTVVTKTEMYMGGDTATENVQHFPHSSWNFDDIIFPDISHSGSSYNLSKPLKQYLPSHVEISEFTFDIHEYKSRRKASKDKDNPQVDPYSLQFSHELPTQRPKLMATNWSEYKMMLNDSPDLADIQTPASHLWEGDVTPLVKPSDASSTANLFEKLQVIKSVNLTRERSRHSLDNSIKVSFDVYLPDIHFKKSNPGIPNHRVCVLRSDDNVADLKSLVAVQSHLQDSVPLHWAVVDSGEIVFYTITDASLPTDITMG